MGRWRISLEGLGLAVLALALVLSVSRCNAMRDGRDAERLAQLERNAYKSSLANLATRRTADSVARENIVAAQRLARSVANTRKISAQLGAVLAANDSLLSAYALNPADDDSTYKLKLQLQRTTEVARLHRDSTDVLLGSIADYTKAVEAERKAWLAERESAAQALAAERKISEHLRKQARCRVLGVPCVSRVNAYLGGILTGLLLVSVL
jgi:hypothetical protein